METQKEAYIVTIKIAATPSKYSAELEFTDHKDKRHTKELVGERKSTVNSNILFALETALRILRCSCVLNICTESDYLTAAVRCGWLGKWQQNGWKNAKGQVIGNVEQWRRVTELLAAHSYKIIKLNGEEE